MTCAHIVGDPEHPCGRPAVALWSHPVTGDWAMCRRHHDAANVAIAASVFVGTPWTHTPLSPETREDGPGAAQDAGVAA